MWWLAGWVAFAAPLGELPIQGSISGADGAPLNGSASVRFRLWPSASGGVAVHDATQTLVVSDGVFATALGAGGTLDLALFATNPQTWVSITVDGVESDRVAVGAAPYAAWAHRAGDAGSLGGAAPSEYVRWTNGYTPGAGLTLTGAQFSAVPYTPGAGLTLSGQQFAAVPYTAGAGLALTGQQFSALPYTAGSGITVSGQQISANLGQLATSLAGSGLVASAGQIGLQTTAITLPAGSTVAGSAIVAGLQPGYGLPNLLGNGGFDIWQRGNTSMPDLWYASGTVAWSRLTAQGARANVSRLVPTGTPFVFQKLENPGDYAGLPLTLSIDMRSAGGGTIRIDDGVAATFVAIPNTGGNFQRVTLRHTVAASPTRLAVRLDPTVQTDVDAAALYAGSWSDAVYTPLDPALDLVRAQRYYETGSSGLYSDDSTENPADTWRFAFSVVKAAAPTVVVSVAESNNAVGNFVGPAVTSTATGFFDFDVENENPERGTGTSDYTMAVSWAATVAVSY
jgi:hypothetical protein